MVFNYILYAIFFIGLACLEWFRYLTHTPPNPWLFTVTAILVTGYASFRVVRLRKKIKLLRLGREGERAVGEYLDRMRKNGYFIFHDVLGEGFNIDHVVCAPSGIYTIETKTRSKPVKGVAKIIVEGEKILINGQEMDRDAIAQSKAQASWLQSVLQESTGKKYPVQPVIVFPGWFVENKGPESFKSVWVLNPKALPSFFENAAQKLEEPELHMVSFHLARYIRSLPE